VYQYIFFRIGYDTQLAEDLTSETFLKAIEHFDDFDETKSFNAWIYRIAHNLLVDHYKRSKIETTPLENAENDVKEEAAFAAEIDRKSLLKKIHFALEKLPQQQKDVVILKYVNELDTKEIAHSLDMEESHVRVLLSRATQTLNKQFSFFKD